MAVGVWFRVAMECGYERTGWWRRDASRSYRSEARDIQVPEGSTEEES